MNQNIELYIVHNGKTRVDSAPCLMPISSEREDADNIARKVDYCELRAQYWVWKNTAGDPDDYVGFFHFRRYLDMPVPWAPGTVRQQPYRIRKRPQLYKYSYESLYRHIGSFDVVAPLPEYMGFTVYERYSHAKGHDYRHLEEAVRILLRRHSELRDAARAYLGGKYEYYGNIYIMKRRCFYNYCQILFPVLEEFDRTFAQVPPKTDGYIAERLFGIYFTYLKAYPGVQCAELPRIHFSAYDDLTHHFAAMRAANILLPPGSLRRAAINKLRHKIMKEWYCGQREKDRNL